MEREEFEAWIAGAPYERDTSRFSGGDEQTAWPGQYRDLAVQLAWEAWQKARGAEGWTPTAEALPAEGVEVLVWLPGRHCVVIAAWHNWPGGLTWRGGVQSRYPPEDVLAWMPLPARPEEGDEAE